MTYQPLAHRLRPTCLDQFVGQVHLLGAGKPLRRLLESQTLYSMIFWGPPGTGKTTLAKIIARHVKAEIEMLSAVMAGVKDIRQVVARAQQSVQPTVLFIDEIHRFNKAQQDALLPFVEDGTLTLIGATTENPSFELNNALLSRAKVYVLKRLTVEDIGTIITQALEHVKTDQGVTQIDFPPPLQTILAQAADGDARRALNLLEMAIDLGLSDGGLCIDETIINDIVSGGVRRFDKGGEAFYDQISALHKAVRGSSPDAALYWLCRMLDGGCDPVYVARRIVRMASEDIGNADPRGLQLALQAWEVYDRLGSPEGELALAQAVIYLAVAAKSNAVYQAFNEAMSDIKKYGSLDVPLHLRNAPTQLMKQLDYGKNYRYAHSEKDAYAAGENYFPEDLGQRQYYHPTSRGLEIKIAEKLQRLKSLDKESA